MGSAPANLASETALLLTLHFTLGAAHCFHSRQGFSHALRGRAALPAAGPAWPLPVLAGGGQARPHRLTFLPLLRK